MENIFDNWNHLKKSLNARDLSHIYFKEGDIWWLHLGQNIKSESYSKGELFSRPVLVLKKLSADMFIAIPLSTKIKNELGFMSMICMAKNIPHYCIKYEYFTKIAFRENYENLTKLIFETSKKL